MTIHFSRRYSLAVIAAGLLGSISLPISSSFSMENLNPSKPTDQNAKPGLKKLPMGKIPQKSALFPQKLPQTESIPADISSSTLVAENDERKELQLHLDAVTKEKNFLVQTIRNQEQELEEAKRATRILEETLQESQEQNQQLVSELNDKRSTISELKTSLNLLSEKLRSENEEKKILNQRVEESLSERQQNKEKIKNLEEDVEELISQNRELLRLKESYGLQKEQLIYNMRHFVQQHGDILGINDWNISLDRNHPRSYQDHLSKSFTPPPPPILSDELDEKMSRSIHEPSNHQDSAAGNLLVDSKKKPDGSNIAVSQLHSPNHSHQKEDSMDQDFSRLNPNLLEKECNTLEDAYKIVFNKFNQGDQEKIRAITKGLFVDIDKNAEEN